MDQATIDQLIKDQIGSAALVPTATDGQAAIAIANYVAEANSLAATLNAQEVTNYNVEFDNYQLGVSASQISPPYAPPQPPNQSWMAAKGSNGWTYCVLVVGVPPCQPRVLKIPITGPAGPIVVKIGTQIPGTQYWFADQGDTAPAGYTTPDPVTTDDGITGWFQKLASIAARYKKVG